MSTVYQHQLHAHKIRRRHPRRWLALFAVLLVAGLVYGFQQLKPETVISQTKPTTKTLKTTVATERFTKGAFAIDLPKGWQFMSKQQDLYTIYHFKSTLPGEGGNRSLEIYEDSDVAHLAVNRMVPVVATDEGGLSANASEVSDNCTAYTTGATAGRQTVGQTAKWQGIEFVCDMANPLRNVVGTGSIDGMNTVTVKTATSRPHRYFFMYTDNNSKPDYGIFTTALNSFKVIE